MHYVSIKVIYGLKIFSVLIINTRNPAVYSAAELIIKAVSVIGNVLYGYYIVLILADKRYFITLLCFGNIRDIDHKLIHTNSAYDIGEFAVNQNLAFV